MFTGIFMAGSVALIAAMRKRSWSTNYMPLIVLAVALICYVGGQYLDGTAPSLTLDYIRGFVLAVAGQQALHRMVKNTDWFQAVEAVGDVPAPIAPAPDRVTP